MRGIGFSYKQEISDNQKQNRPQTWPLEIGENFKVNEYEVFEVNWTQMQREKFDFMLRSKKRFVDLSKDPKKQTQRVEWQKKWKW